MKICEFNFLTLICNKTKLIKAGNIFSFGVIAWELLTHQIPWKECSVDKLIEQIAHSGSVLPIPSDCPEKLRKLLIDCWCSGILLVISSPKQPDPSDRPSADAVVRLINEAYPILPPSEFKEGAQLGQGSFGAVYAGKYKNEPVALKFFRGEVISPELKIIR